MLLRVAVVLVGIYRLVSDTVVVWECTFLDSAVAFDPLLPPSTCGVGEGVAKSRVLSGVLRASSINSWAFVMER